MYTLAEKPRRASAPRRTHALGGTPTATEKAERGDSLKGRMGERNGRESENERRHKDARKQCAAEGCRRRAKKNKVQRRREREKERGSSCTFPSAPTLSTTEKEDAFYVCRRFYARRTLSLATFPSPHLERQSEGGSGGGGGPGAYTFPRGPSFMSRRSLQVTTRTHGAASRGGAL